MTFDLVHTALLPAAAPFSLSPALRSMTRFRPCSGDQLVLGDSVRKALPVPGSPDEAVVVEVRPRPDAVPGIELRVYGRGPLAPSPALVEGVVSDWLGLADDLGPFLDRAAADPPVAALLRAVDGLHQVRFSSLAEGAAYFTLTQRSTQWFAAARKARIAADLGPRATLDGVSYVAFPSLPRLVALGADGLLAFAGNAQRAIRLHEVLAGIADLDEEWLRTVPYDEARRALLRVRGVGAFTAHAILLRVLGRPDDVPLEMAQFTSLAAAVYGADATPSPAVLRARYGPYVGWWAHLCRTAAREGIGSDQPSEASQRSSVRTPQPVAPLVSSASALSAQAGADMSMCAQRPFEPPVNSRRNSAAITDPAPIEVELSRSVSSPLSAST
jgi:DNA-3-methyladenine glycosylase II